jgi:hypothetical protein
MSRTIVTAAVAVVLLAAGSAAEAQQFEGVLEQRMRLFTSAELPDLAPAGGGDAAFAAILERPVEELPAAPGSSTPTMEMTISIKGGRMRIDTRMPGLPMDEMGAMYMLFDNEGDEVAMVIPAMRQIMVVSTSEMARVQEANVQQQMHHLEGETQLRPLGDSTLHGVAVRGVEIRQGRTMLRMWVAPQYAQIGAALAEMQKSMPVMQPPPGAGNLDPVALGLQDAGLPVRTQVVAPGPGGAFMYVVMDVPRIERRALADELFVRPADFAVERMPTGALQP